MKKFVVIIGTLFFLLSLAVVENQAATLTVTNNNNSGTGSLRQQIINANDGDKIIFAAGLNGSIFLSSALPIDKNLTINGPGANILSVEGRSSPTGSRVFSVFTSTVKISDLRIANGFSSGAGGGITVESGGNLTLNNCVVSGNTAESGGGVIIFNNSTLTITNSTFTGNTSFVEGGGISNRGGTLTLINSTINGNEAPRGGGVSVENGTATILNSTISSNSTGDSSTSNVGGLRIIFNSPQTANVMLKNTIVANNSASFAPIADFGVSIADVGGTVNSQGNNLIGNTAGGNGFIASDLLNINPQLAALADNGGTTPTQALMAGSPAVDAGNNSGAPATDQRGAARPVGSSVDIGAFESGVTVTSGNTPTGSNVNTSLGAVSLTFSGVSTAGTTTQIPISPSTTGTLPGGYTFGAGYPAFEITTTAVYTAPISVCLQVPGVTTLAVFNALNLFHGEGGVLIDRTSSRNFATKTICAIVNSLSPFAVAQNLAPTAANVSISGRVVTANQRGISKARVSITDQNGETRTALTNPFGNFRFADVGVGQTYIINIRHKEYQFNSQVLTVSEEIQNADFTAEP